MSKNTIKKIILTIVILSVLILALVFFYRITSENYKNDISISKKIISEKYEDIVSFDNSYLCAYKENEYTIFDYNGNRLYSFNSPKGLDVVSATKKYFITRDNNYHLFNVNYEEIVSGENIYGITDHMVFVDNNIINMKGEILFSNVKNIKPCYKNKYFVIDNSFINEKGKILLDGYDVVKEKINKNEIDYFIVKKDNKYYSFFPLVDNIIGDAFDKFFEYKNEIYIVTNNKIYMISTNGLRKEITFNINKNIYKIDYKNAVRKDRVLTIRDYYLGLLETDTNKFHKIEKANNFSYKYIDSSHINILFNNKNIVYDLDNYKTVYTNNFDDIVIFKNNYKTIKKNGMYYLLDDKERSIATSDKQIILINSKMIIGKPEENIMIFSDDLYDGKTVLINNKEYYKYEINNTKYLVSVDLKEKYESNMYLSNMTDTIVKIDSNKIYFYNKKNNRTYNYDLKDFNIINNEINKNELILSNNKDIIVLNSKGKVIKKIRNSVIKDISYNKQKQAIIMIVEKDKMFKKYKGAYVFK